jgi:hypothetical protein
MQFQSIQHHKTANPLLKVGKLKLKEKNDY